MKKFLAIAIVAAFTASAFAADVPAVQNDKCVKKDKQGKCPPLPNSPKPTPKKKAEAAK